jgi:hypothetical protein
MVAPGVAFVAEQMGVQLVCRGVGKVWFQRHIFLRRPQYMVADPHKGQCAPAKVPNN